MDRSVADFSVSVGGQALPAAAELRLLEIEVDSDLHRPELLRLELADPDEALVEEGPLTLGAELLVRLGVPGALGPAAGGKITRIEWSRDRRGRRLRVVAYGGRHPLERAQRQSSFVDCAVGEALEGAARGTGVEVSAGAATLGRDVLLQGAVSVGHLLRQWSARLGLWVEEGVGSVEVGALRLAQASRTCTWGEDLIELDLEVDGLSQVTGVQVSGVDPAAREVLLGEAHAQHALDRMGGGFTGADAARALWGEALLKVADRPVRSQAEVDALAAALFNDRLFGFVTGTARVRGDSSLRAGGVVELAGIHPRLAGRYLLLGATHRLSHEGGFVSQLRMCRPSVTRQ